MRVSIPLMLVLGACVLVAQAGAAPSSGVSGKVIKAPITPVCREGVRCSAPAAGVALGFMRMGTVVGRTTSARDGTFRISLPPGTYGVRLMRNPAFGVLRPRSVVVAAGRFTALKLVIDTGIRSVSGNYSSLP